MIIILCNISNKMSYGEKLHGILSIHSSKEYDIFMKTIAIEA